MDNPCRALQEPNTCATVAQLGRLGVAFDQSLRTGGRPRPAASRSNAARTRSCVHQTPFSCVTSSPAVRSPAIRDPKCVDHRTDPRRKGPARASPRASVPAPAAARRHAALRSLPRSCTRRASPGGRRPPWPRSKSRTGCSQRPCSASAGTRAPTAPPVAATPPRRARRWPAFERGPTPHGVDHRLAIPLLAARPPRSASFPRARTRYNAGPSPSSCDPQPQREARRDLRTLSTATPRSDAIPGIEMPAACIAARHRPARSGTARGTPGRPGAPPPTTPPRRCRDSALRPARGTRVPSAPTRPICRARVLGTPTTHASQADDRPASSSRASPKHPLGIPRPRRHRSLSDRHPYDTASSRSGFRRGINDIIAHDPVIALGSPPSTSPGTRSTVTGTTQSAPQ